MPAHDPSLPSSKLHALGRALRHRNYRLYFSGQSLSLIGTWMTRIATGWLIYRLTGSALLLGTVGFAGQLPVFLLAPVAGVLADRWDRHRVLVVTQILAMIQSGLLAVLALTDIITVTHVLVLATCQGLINAFDMPARQALVVQMVDDRRDLPNAIALNSSMVNAARMVGPSVAGLLIGWVGEGVCFLVDAVSYLAVIATLILMRLKPPVRPAVPKRVVAEFIGGLRYAAGFPPVRAILALLALLSLAAMPYAVLMPIVASRILHGGAHTLGFLMAASGLGALGAGVYLASRSTVLGLGRVIAAAVAAAGVGLIGLSQSNVLWLSLALMPIIGAGVMIEIAASNTLLQTMVDDDMRGRVMAFYTMAFVGTMPFGSLVAGAFADRFGVPTTLLVGGVACIVGAAIFLARLPSLRRLVLPIYVRLGIIPEIANGMNRASDV
ncbi:MAG: MFS transporter [Holophagae bacterium]|jgi:MFS family permease